MYKNPMSVRPSMAIQPLQATRWPMSATNSFFFRAGDGNYSEMNVFERYMYAVKTSKKHNCTGLPCLLCVHWRNKKAQRRACIDLHAIYWCNQTFRELKAY